jgi:5-methylcytosine-specific restriction endonuclease McrA
MGYRFCLTCNTHHPLGERCAEKERRRYAASRQRRIRSTARWQKARAAARQRDGNRCRRCPSTERLEVHHIVSLEDGGARYDLNNLITLCSSCHLAAGRDRGERGSTGRGALTPPSSLSRKTLQRVEPRPRFSRSTLHDGDTAPFIG